MLRMRGGDEAHRQQRLAGVALGHEAAHGEIHAPVQQRLVVAAQHGLIELHAGLRQLVGEARQGLQQEPGGKDDLHRDAHLRLPAGGQERGALLHRLGPFQQGAGATQQGLPGGGELGLAALELEQLTFRSCSIFCTA